MNERRKGERRQRSQPVDPDRRRTDRRNSSDRRQRLRLPVEMWMEEVAGNDIYFRRTGNVSPGGVYFDKAIPHPVGTCLTLKFNLPGTDLILSAHGVVISIAADGLGMGVRFDRFDGDGAEQLERFIAGLARRGPRPA